MKYKINSTGNTVIADPAFMDAVYPGDHTLLPDDAAPAPATPRVLTKTQYMARFTDAELAGIYSAAKSVVLIEVWLERFRAATEIDLDYGPTAQGVAALEAAGLLAPGRAAEILA